MLVTSLLGSLFYPFFANTVPNYCIFLRIFFAENAGNDISETLNLNIFWGSMPPRPPCLERRRSSNFSSSAYNFKISLYSTEFKNFSRLREPWHCIEFQFEFVLAVLGPVLARDKNTLPRNRILESILDSEAYFGFSKVHGFRLRTFYISLRAERPGFDGGQSKWLAEPFHRLSHYLASMLKVCFFI